MAIYHNSVSIIQRSAGKSSVAAAAYRSGEKLKDERTGLIHDYTRKSGVDESMILTPIKADWITDRQQLWNKVEAAERRGDSQLAREITLAIPVELNREDKIELVLKYVQKNYVDLGMIADINYHNLDGNNPHSHIMLSMRDLKIDERGDVSFGKKNREWNDWQDAASFIKNRESWAKLANQYLVNAGYPDIQIDHRSNADRGIETIPQIHLGAKTAARRQKGIASARGNEYDQIEIANDNIRQKLEQIYESECATRDLEQQLVDFERRVNDRERNKSQFYEKVEIHTEVAKPPASEHKKTLEYQAARKRDKSQFYENIEIPKQVVKPTPAPKVKERITLYQKTDPQLVRSILETGNRLGMDCYQAGNYHVQISPKQIEVRHQNTLAVIIDISSCLSLLIDRDRSFTLNQYEQGLKGSIDVLVTDLQQQREQTQAKEGEQQRQSEPEQLEQSEQREPELELSRNIIDDSKIVDDPKIDIKPLVNKNLSRGSRDWNR